MNRWKILASTSLLLLVASSSPLRAQSFDVAEATIASTHAALRAGRTTCRAIVQQYLDRIEAYDKTGPSLNTIQHVNARALVEADSLDAAMRAGRTLGPLHCVTVLLKDQIETRDMPTTYGSAIFKGFMSQRDATVVTRLEAAGAIILAKTTMGEFAARYVGSAFGFIRNAYDPTRNPSGSSGGTGSSVAANFGLVGIGEDTGGSVRGPAAVSNLFGLRPTLQLVSRHGMLPANPTQDTMGPMTRTAMDAALLLNVMVGYDSADAITAYAVGQVPASYATGLKRDALRGARIGVLRTSSDTGTDKSSDDYKKVRAVVDRAIADLRAQGATVVDSVLIPEIIAASRLSNDFETEQATNAYLTEHPNAPVRTLKEIVLSGKVVPWRAKGLISLVGKTMDDPGYLQVIRKRETLRVAVLKLMANERLDAIIYATFDHQPTVIAEDVETNASPKDGYGRGDNRGLSPMIGFPALAIPAGFTTDGLPVGIDMLGRPFSEAMLLRYGYAFEQATDRRRPPAATPSLSPRARGAENR